MNISREGFARFERNSKDFLRRFVPVDKTWIHHHAPETKQVPKTMDDAKLFELFRIILRTFEENSIKRRLMALQKHWTYVYRIILKGNHDVK